MDPGSNFLEETGQQIFSSVTVLSTLQGQVEQMPAIGSMKPVMIFRAMEGKLRPLLWMAVMFMFQAGIITVLVTGKISKNLI